MYPWRSRAGQGRFAGPHLVADKFLGVDYLLRHGAAPLGVGGRDNQDSIELGQHHIARADSHLTDRHRDLGGDHLPPADGVEGRHIAVEDLEADVP